MLHEWAKYRYGVFDEPKQGDGTDADDGFFPTFFCPPTLATLDALRNATIHVPNVNIGQRSLD